MCHYVSVYLMFVRKWWLCVLMRRTGGFRPEDRDLESINFYSGTYHSLGNNKHQ